MLYLFVSTPLAPVLTSVLARADQSHQVTVQHTTGGIRVVLHHNGSNSRTHRHGIIARALALVAQSPSNTNPDHVIQFKASDSFSWSAQLKASEFETFEQPDLAVKKLSLAVLRGDFQSSLPTHPPPLGNAQLLSLRSTLLLI